MIIDEKKTVEYNFDRMREVISNTRLPINVGDTTVGETTLREGDVFRLATALINEGFRLERNGKWITAGEELKNTTCSNCGHWVETPYGKTVYCAECGSRMEEGNEK